MFTSFLAGEVSPKVWARSNTELYKQGCEEIENMIVSPSGGAMKRPPTIKSNTSLYSDSTQRLIPISTSRGESLVVIIRPGSTTTWKILDLSTGSTVDVAPFSDATFTATSTEIHRYQYCVAGDRVYFSYESRPPFVLKLSYSVDTLLGADLGLWWQIDGGLATPWDRRPYQDFNTGGITITPSATTGTWTTPGTGVLLTASSALFYSGLIGTFIKLSDSTSTGTGVFLVLEYLTTTTVRGTVSLTLPSTVAFGGASTNGWEMEEWDSTRGYPNAVTFFQDRVWYGGNKYSPDTIWGSSLGNYDFFMFRPLEQDAAFTGYATDATRAYKLQITTADTPRILWMEGNKTLTIGSYNKEYVIAPGVDGIGPGIFPQLTSQTTKGSRPYIKPVMIDSDLYFVSGKGRSICNFEYNLDENAYKSSDITTLGEFCFVRHWAEYGKNVRWKIKAIAHQSADSRDVLWILDTCGGLTGVTIEKKTGVLAFHRHYFGGNYGSVPPKVESICVVNGVLVLSVKRKINNVDNLWIEYLSGEYVYSEYKNLGDLSRYEFLDSQTMDVSSTTATFTVGSAYNGESVSCILDGLYIGELTVSGGNVVIPSKYVTGATKYLTVGFKYSSKLVTLPLEAGSQIGSSQGLTKRIDQVVLRFFNTQQCKVSQKGGNVEEVSFRTPLIHSDDLVPLYTDDKVMQFPSNYDRKSQIVLESDVPLALNISGIAARGVTYD